MEETASAHLPFTIYHSLLEGVERLGLVVEGVEDGQELGDAEQVANLLRQLEELQLPALALDGGEAGDQLADAGGIDVADVGQVEQNLLLVLFDQAAHGAAERDAALPDGDLAVHVEDGHVPGLALADVQFSHCG